MKKEFSILVAEDDFGHFALIKRHLNRLGFTSRILHFKDGQEILDYLFDEDGNSNLADPIKKYMVILDIRMPKVDGIEVLSRIRNSNQLKTLPVLMLTSSDDREEIEKCQALGCNDYIIKPLQYNAFSQIMQRVADSLLFSIIDIIEINPKIKKDSKTDQKTSQN